MRVNSEMHLEALIERVWRCPWRPTSSELRAAIAGHDRESMEMHFDTEIEQTQRCIFMPSSSKLRDALGGHDRLRLGEYL